MSSRYMTGPDAEPGARTYRKHRRPASPCAVCSHSVRSWLRRSPRSVRSLRLSLLSVLEYETGGGERVEVTQEEDGERKGRVEIKPDERESEKARSVIVLN